MNLCDILNQKGRAVYTVSPRASLAEAVRLMVEQNCGSLVVCDNQTMVGILSERDILKAIVATQRPLDEIAIADRMTVVRRKRNPSPNRSLRVHLQPFPIHKNRSSP